MGSHAWTEKYARIVQIAGSVYEWDVSTSGSANSTTIARYLLGGLSIGRRWGPLATATNSTPALPAVGTAPANMGWREKFSQEVTDKWTVDPNDIFATLRLLRSGKLGEINVSGDVTVIFYRVTDAGAFISELARATQNLTFTTAATSHVFTQTLGAVQFNPGDKIQTECYVHLDSAPATETDLIIRIQETTPNVTKLNGPAFALNFEQPISAVLSGVPTLARTIEVHKTLSATMLGVASITRKVGKTLSATMLGVASITRKTSRTLTATMLGVASLTRKTGKTLSATMLGVATLTPALVLFRTLSATMRGVATLTPKLTFRRTLSAVMRGVARAFIRLPFDKVPSGGGPTSKNILINIFDD